MRQADSPLPPGEGQGEGPDVIKRRFAIVLIFLLLGAIVNIAVAWACALWAPTLLRDNSDLLVHSDSMHGINLFTAEDWLWGRALPTSTHEWLTETDLHYGGVGFDVDYVKFLVRRPGTFNTGYDRMLQQHIAGWPYRSCGCVARLDAELMLLHALMPPQSLRGLPVEWQMCDPPFLRPVPLQPLWPGFAINTLFYAAILWLLVALPGALRRWRRIKRGLCPACAYPVGTSDLCTECGKPIPLSLRDRVRVRAQTS